MKIRPVLLVVLALISINVMAQKPTLIYVGDPMCSWCYGFSNEINDAKKELSGEFDFVLVMGGLRPYNTETMADLGDFLKHHWEQVNSRSGQPFSYEILSNKSFVYDTEPPSRAVRVMRELAPQHEFEFFRQIQKAFYVEGKNTGRLQTYLDMLPKFGVDAEVFRAQFESDAMKQAIKADFQLSANMGVRGFPTVLVRYNDQLQMISNGYASSESIVKKAQQVIQ